MLVLLEEVVGWPPVASVVPFVPWSATAKKA